MSGNIDNRVVSMLFDNKQFETGVATSMNTLNNLKKGLDLSGSAKGLESINDSVKRVTFDGLSNGIEAVKVKFSALQVIAITALANIANSAINAGKSLISSLTIDPIKDGFKEYETQMNSIQTILANTSSKGTSLDQVKAALSELNTYSDKTIYNFTEMARNIGTFTAAGVDLDKSTQAIKGIANLAAVSGSSSEQASTAMYQLSQALAAGKVNLQDWNSVVNAGMGGAVFQNSLKETGKLMGKNIDESQSFRDSISDKDGTGWLTSDVLLATLQKFTGDMTESQLAAQGYTETQIAGILKMGQTANDAATKVKTFTQLMDTLKEAVGSGWAQTWQTLFGDFDEAKVMFTNVSNVLGGLIGASSKARNDMLTGWKDLGGRTALIDGIGIAFTNVMNIINAFSSALKTIFPPITSAQLFALTEGLKNLMTNLTLSSTNLTNLQSTFKGFFAILDIIKTVVMAAGNAIFIMMGGVGNLGSTILGVTGSFGEWLTALDNSIKKSGVFDKVFSTLAYGIKNAFTGIAVVFDVVIKALGTLRTYLESKLNFSGFDALKTFLESIGNGMSAVGDNANSMSTVVINAFKSMYTAIAGSKIGELFKVIWDTIKMAVEGIGTLMGKLGDYISESLKNVNLDTIIGSIAAMSVGGMFLAFKKFMSSLSEPLDEAKSFFGKIGDSFEGIKGTLDGVRGSLETYQQNLKADILLKIGAAIALLAGSILIISTIDSNKLGSSLSAIGILFAELLVAMKVYTAIGDMKLKTIAASSVMIIMSTSILILSAAMKSLSELDWEGIKRGGTGVAILAAIIVEASKLLSANSGTMIKGATGMIGFSVAIKILAGSCVELSKLNWEQLKMGLIGVGALMVEMSLFLNNTTFGPKAISNAIGMTILAGAIKILASAVGDFGSMDWGNISKGLKAIGALLLELAVFTNVTGNAKSVISTSISLIAIGEAMKILASAVGDFGSMDWGTIEKGLKAMGITLAEITIAVNLMPKDMMVTGLALVVVAKALDMMAGVLGKMGAMSWSDITAGLVLLGGSLTILSVALYAMSGSLAGSAALLVAAGALAILAPTLVILGAMSWESIIKGLVDLAATIAIFGVAALLLTPVIPAMLGLSASLVLLGIAMLGIGAGLTLVGVGLAGVAAGFIALAGVTATGAAAIVGALGIIIMGIAALIPAIAQKIAEGIVVFCKAFADGIPAILDAVTVIIKAIVDCIVTNTPVIIDGVLKTLSAILAAIIQWMPTIGQQVADIILALLKIIADNIEKFAKAGADIIVGFIKGITDSLPKIVDAALNLIITFINSLADGIRSNSAAIGDACLNLVMAIVDGIGTLNDKFIDAGIYAVEGFIKGITSLPGKIWDAGCAIGRSALEGAKKAIDSNSPSKEFAKLGSYSGQGFIVGLDSYNNKVSDASYNMGAGAVDSMSNAISGISDIVNGNIDSQPVIRPVMDLTSVQNGSNQLYSMMDGLNGYGINGSVNTANSTVNSIQRNNQSSNTDTMDNQSTIGSGSSQLTSKQPLSVQLVLQNGKAIAEYIIDDVDNLMGAKNKITGRMAGSV